MKPDANGTGIYRGCIGPASRGLNCRDPGHGYYYHDETNAFWELTLGETPRDVLIAAQRKAAEAVQIAASALQSFDGCTSGEAELRRVMDEAQSELARGTEIGAEGRSRDEQLASLARRIRALTRAQARAAQVTDASQPPGSLKAWLGG